MVDAIDIKDNFTDIYKKAISNKTRTNAATVSPELTEQLKSLGYVE